MSGHFYKGSFFNRNAEGNKKSKKGKKGKKASLFAFFASFSILDLKPDFENVS